MSRVREAVGGRCDGNEGDVSRKTMSTKEMYIFLC